MNTMYNYSIDREYTQDDIQKMVIDNGITFDGPRRIILRNPAQLDNIGIGDVVMSALGFYEDTLEDVVITWDVNHYDAENLSDMVDDWDTPTEIIPW